MLKNIVLFKLYYLIIIHIVSKFYIWDFSHFEIITPCIQAANVYQ